MVATGFGWTGLVVGVVVWFAGDSTRDERLLGRWNAQAMAVGGKPAPKDAVKRMRFTFTPDKLLLRGNFQDDREAECTYKVDSSKAPHELEFLPPEVKEPILGIYRIQDGKLQVVFRREGKSGGRPKTFEVEGEESLIALEFVLEESKK